MAAEEAELRVSGELSEILDLRDWLRRQRGLEGAVREVLGEPDETELGGGLVELLIVALGAQGAGSVLARSLPVWLSTRRSKVAVTVTTSRGSVTVEAEGPAVGDASGLLEQVLRGEG